jgi:hypothetical protein
VSRTGVAECALRIPLHRKVSSKMRYRSALTQRWSPGADFTGAVRTNADLLVDNRKESMYSCETNRTVKTPERCAAL